VIDSRLYLIEVKPQHRRGRARYWKAGGYGYTDAIHEAGLYSRDEAVSRCRGNTEGIHRPVPAERRLRPALREAQALVDQLRGMLTEAGTLRRSDRREMDFETRAHLRALRDTKKHGGVPRVERERQRLQAEADAWNAAHPVGTQVRYWTGLREGEGVIGEVRHPAQVMADHVSAWVTGHPACIAITHIEAVSAGGAP
jgi:hypothetical protein